MIFLWILSVLCSSTVGFKTNPLNVSIVDLFFEEIERLPRDDSCATDLIRYWEGINNLELWAFQMIDATSKIPSGLLSGNLEDLGMFDQCLNVDTVTNDNYRIKGQHCMAQLVLPRSLYAARSQQTLSSPNIEPRVGDEPDVNLSPFVVLAALPVYLSYCIPDSCSAAQLQTIFSSALSNSTLDLIFFEDRCQSKAKVKDLDGAAWGTIGFFIFILVITLLSTVYDYFIQRKKKKPSHIILIAFSVYTNGKKILSTSKNPEQMSCLNGIKAISMIWIILCHTYIMITNAPPYNFDFVFQWIDRWYAFYIAGGHLSVDTFFVLGGLLIVYGYLRAAERGHEFNLRRIIVFYLHRYLRLTPVYIVTILFSANLTYYLGSGPTWPRLVESVQKPCQDNWWVSLIYGQNYIDDYQQVCYGPSWYLAIDMQLYILSPLLLIPLAKWPKYTLIAMGWLLVVSIGLPFGIVWHYKMKGFYLDVLNQATYMKKYYFQTYCRYGTWLMGCFLGYILFKTRGKKISIKAYVVIVLWITALATMLASMLGGHSTLQHSYNRLEATGYVVFTRFSWSLGLCWVIFACVHGYGGWINDFLCLHFFQVWAKISYAVYLTHYYIQMLIAHQSRVPTEYSDWNFMHRFWGDFAFATVAGVVVTLTFESPMITIEKVLFGLGAKSKPKRKEDLEKSDRNNEVPKVENGLKEEV